MIREALAVLGLEENAHPEEIRRRYRMLMHSFHPDTAGNGETAGFFQEKAKQLNEAYRLLKSSGCMQSVQSGKDPHIRRNEAAYCSRRIYMEEELCGDPVWIDTGLYGRYCWDPETEPFMMLLKSVNETVRKLVDEYQEKAKHGNKNPFAMKQISEQKLQAKLLHLLLQEYIDPLLCLDALPFCREEDPGTEENEPWRSWRIRCHLRSVSPDERKTIGGNKKALAVKALNSRLFAVDDTGAGLGQISFAENELYYIVTPLILRGEARAVFECADASLEKDTLRRHSGGGRAANTRADTVTRGHLLLQVFPGKRKDPTAAINREIERTLQNAEAFLNI